MFDAVLYLEKGHLFEGQGFGACRPLGGEAVFNTGMTGYQEIFTDPSYYKQIVVMGGVQMGNTGINFEDVESKSLYLSGVVFREYTATPSNWRSKKPLHEYLEEAGVPGISDVDTRRITQILRDEGAQRAILFPKSEVRGETRAHAEKLLKTVPSMEGLELVSLASCKEPYEFSRGDSQRGTVIVYDFGVKLNILRSFAERGFRVKVVPFQTSAEEVLSESPTAVVLSNGPGDPAKVPTAVQAIEKLIGKIPMLAICMGHQLLARALGGETYKLKFGHHGINHPVKDLQSGRILITSQNHGFAVKAESLPKSDVMLSHVNLNDHTVEGFTSEKMKFYSVQFHPESKPGPNDAAYIFDHFIRGFLQ